MNGRIALVTGGNDGIGEVTCRALAERGATVLLVSRDRGRGEAAAARIREGVAGADVHVLQCDLSSLAQVRRLAAEVQEGWPALHVLVNNAGAFFADHAETDDGHERSWQVNYLAPYLLTRLLLDRLIASTPARVVHVSSRSHRFGRIHWDDVSLLGRYDGVKAYGQNKLANVLFSNELARRLAGTGVTSNALHPGVVRTEIANKDGWWVAKLVWASRKPFMISRERGAATSILLASDPALEGVTGAYYSVGRRKAPSKRALDEAAQARLWELSAAAVGLEA